MDLQTTLLNMFFTTWLHIYSFHFHFFTYGSAKSLYCCYRYQTYFMTCTVYNDDTIKWVFDFRGGKIASEINIFNILLFHSFSDTYLDLCCRYIVSPASSISNPGSPTCLACPKTFNVRTTSTGKSELPLGVQTPYLTSKAEKGEDHGLSLGDSELHPRHFTFTLGCKHILRLKWYATLCIAIYAHSPRISIILHPLAILQHQSWSQMTFRERQGNNHRQTASLWQGWHIQSNKWAN